MKGHGCDVLPRLVQGRSRRDCPAGPGGYLPLARGVEFSERTDATPKKTVSTLCSFQIGNIPGTKSLQRDAFFFFFFFASLSAPLSLARFISIFTVCDA